MRDSRSSGTNWGGWVSGALFAVLLYVGMRPVGSLPALGNLLDPYRGVWSVAGSAELEAVSSVEIAGVRDDVSVIYDDRSVPHIFAASREDAFRALGYVVARDRLFQMELQWRLTAGRLSELFGVRTLGLDKSMRALWLAASADAEYASLSESSGDVKRLIDAYAEGVNAWIDQMNLRQIPFEYHFIGKRPVAWDPVYSLYLVKQMGFTLAGSSIDRRWVRVAERVGPEAASALFPVHSPIQEPIQPNGASTRFDFTPLPPPRINSASTWTIGEATELDLLGLGAAPLNHASNNWVVAPQRTANGYALLAGDPHLDLTIPSIWYEVHVVVPGELDVYGATFPGAPFIIVGFNRDVAWSFTNTGADVMDFYRERLDDPETPTSYRLDGEWVSLESRVEEYSGTGQEVLEIDTLYRNHRGPIVQLGDTVLSMRWTVLESPRTSSTFSALGSSGSVAEWIAVMNEHDAPPQNGAVADRWGSIALRSFGLYPVRPDNGNGVAIRDGTTSDSDWIGYWPVDRYPGAVDPEQGFLASNNQEPVDPRHDDAFLGADWWVPWRAIQINQLLRSDSAVTPDAMRVFQTHPMSARANLFVPAFLNAGMAVPTLGEDAREALDLLAEWDREYATDNERAVLFEVAMAELTELVWDELADSTGRRVGTPGEAVLAGLLEDPASVWWDRLVSEEIETRDDVLVSAIEEAYRKVVERFGSPGQEAWRWGGIRHANLMHVARFPGLSIEGIPVQGGRETMSPSSGSGTFGASWRMVVELGPEIRAWTIYPGGQSGNPVSTRYADRVRKWSNGELEEVIFPRAAEEIPNERVTATLILRGAE
ncbi:MAG: penicillin acylase family protein [Gemmatimonadetes bacterium]|nr:penicillin acylase family protein [Gemmatimonadota bacterium]